MKKLMITAAAAFCATVVMANAVESANVVGYNTVTLKPGWNMLGINFSNVADTEGIDINDLFPGNGKSDTVFTVGAGAADADKIQVWDATAGSYTTYFLFKKAKGTSEANYYWCNADGGAISEKKFKNGEAFWFYKRGDSEVTTTISGEVSLNDVKSVEIKPGWNMIGSYFPAGWKLNDETFYTPTYWENSSAVEGAGAADADKIQVWDASTQNYTTYFLFKKAKGSSDDNYKWCNANGGAAVMTDILSAGQGAWYYHRGEGFSLEIKKQF